MDRRESAREHAARGELEQRPSEDGPPPVTTLKRSTVGGCPKRLPRYASLAQAHEDLLSLAAWNPEGTLRGWFFCRECRGIHLKKTGADRRGLTLEQVRQFDRAFPRTAEQLAGREQRALAMLAAGSAKKKRKKKRHAENVRRRKKQVLYSQFAEMLHLLEEQGYGTEIG